MIDIANTLKGLLPKIGFTWDTLLRLFYSLCGCCSAAWHRTSTDVDLASIRALRYMRGALSF